MERDIFRKNMGLFCDVYLYDQKNWLYMQNFYHMFNI